jgi:hypothetical protein
MRLKRRSPISLILFKELLLIVPFELRQIIRDMNPWLFGGRKDMCLGRDPRGVIQAPRLQTHMLRKPLHFGYNGRVAGWASLSGDLVPGIC